MSQVEIQHIIFEGQGRAEIFSFRPEHIEKEKRGNLFLLGKISKTISRKDAAYYMLNSVAAILKKEYYSPSYTHGAQAFEGALKKINSFLTKTKAETLRSLEIVALTLAGNQVTFSFTGKPEVLLLRDDRLFRLAKTRTNDKELFSHVTKGRVKIHDKLIVGTSDLTQWLDRPSFTSRLLRRPWERVREYLAQERIELRDERSMALLTLTINGALDTSFAKESQTLEEVPRETERKVPVMTIPSHAVSLSSKALQPLYSLKRYYVNNWRRHKSLFTLATEIESLIIALKRWVTHLNQSRYIGQRSILKTPAGLAISGVVLLALILGIGALMNQKNQNIEPVNNKKNLQGALFTFSQNTPLSHALLVDDNVYLIVRNQLIALDLTRKILNPLLSLEGEIKGITAYKGSLLILEKTRTNDWEIVSVDPQIDTFVSPIRYEIKSTRRDSLAWPLETDFVKATSEYEGSLYILEGFSKQIVKYRIPQFTKPSLWFSKTAREKLTTPVHFTIDGSVYIIESAKNNITRLRLGDIDKLIPLPPGSAPSELFTSSELKNLYAIDSEKGELIVIDKKSGMVTKTLVNDQLIGMRAARVNELEDTITFVNTRGIFSLSLQQKNNAL